ncbi:MAG TPA: T9SS type A sorting domain-containing protein [Parafilimonas sp.]|nr:T9SS type A sorting domain-containing protein [Parafilimonas sp.]
MKIIYPFFLVVFCFTAILGFANETEPNNSRNTANILALNSNNSGSISAPGDEDWWKITTTADGMLSLYDSVTNTSVFNHQWCWLELYDNNGTTLLYQAYSEGVMKPTFNGLAAGTYYVRIHGDYNSSNGTGTIPNYVLGCQLTAASNNDAEPNDTRAKAKALPLNGNKKGHIGYYYNNQRDLTDWYKVTTSQDGQLNLSLANGNNQTYVYLYLLDSNGTTVIQSNEGYGPLSLNINGLAAGTYYAKVAVGGNNTYYINNGWSTYTLGNTLNAAGTANDAEPNDNYPQAVTLQSNDTITGHIGYYYNNKRDKNDWYKLVLKNDGYLNLSFTRYNTQTDVYFYLYDADGTTLLGSGATISMDGLAAGAYYLQVNCGGSDNYYPYSGWSTYKIATSLSTYANANDTTEPNNQPYLAKILPANKTVTGHVGFYGGHQRDTADYWKINYTGSGALTLNVSLNNWLSNGWGHYFYIQVYKDTATPFYSTYFLNASGDINLTGLTKGYYWVRVVMYYWQSEFGAYTLTNKFTQAKAKIATVSYTATGCTGNTITYKCTQSKPPYTVQLYRFGQKYGNVKTVTGNAQFSFTGLPDGAYFATAFGAGATGNAYGRSDTVSIEPPVTGLNTTNITGAAARLKWTKISCADYYSVKYKKHSAATWTTKQSTGNNNIMNITNLKENTKYDWTVAAIDSQNNIISMGTYADSISFKTASSLIAANNINESDASINGNSYKNIPVIVAPNPASSYFTIRYNDDVKERVSATLYNANGKAVWTSGLMNVEALNGKQVMVNQYAEGLYYLRIVNEKGNMVGGARISIVK